VFSWNPEPNLPSQTVKGPLARFGYNRFFHDIPFHKVRLGSHKLKIIALALVLCFSATTAQGAEVPASVYFFNLKTINYGTNKDKNAANPSRRNLKMIYEAVSPSQGRGSALISIKRWKPTSASGDVSIAWENGQQWDLDFVAHKDKRDEWARSLCQQMKVTGDDGVNGHRSLLFDGGFCWSSDGYRLLFERDPSVTAEYEYRTHLPANDPQRIEQTIPFAIHGSIITDDP